MAIHIAIGALIGAAVGAIGTGVAQAIKGQPLDWKSIAAGAVGGAAAGAVITATCGAGLLAGSALTQTGGMIGAGALGGFGEQVTDNVLHEREWGEDVVKSTATGAVCGAIGAALRHAARPVAALVGRTRAGQAMGNAASAVGGRAKGVWARYLRALETNPVRTKALTSSAISAVADTVAQKFEGRTWADHDWKRTGFFAAWGLAISGPVGHGWYRAMERMIPGTAFSAVAKKVALDQLVMGPPMLAAFLGAHSMVVEEKTFGEAVQRIKDDFLPTKGLSMAFWPGFHMLNFKYVPFHLRIPAGNVAGLGWTAFMSGFLSEDEEDAAEEAETPAGFMDMPLGDTRDLAHADGHAADSTSLISRRGHDERAAAAAPVEIAPGPRSRGLVSSLPDQK
jgi:Mpv17 / PMP22 family